MKTGQLFGNYLGKANVMQLATASDAQPWLCTVNYVVDRQLNMYWLSLRTRRHSAELSQNANCAVTVVVDAISKQAVQMTGEAAIVDQKNLEKVHELYSEWYGSKPERLAEAQSNAPDVRTYYQFIPREIVLFDEVNFPHNPRVEVAI